MTPIESYLKSQGHLIDQHLAKLVPTHHGLYQQLFEAARYSLLGGGKRLRPILALATTHMLEGNIENALSPACTLEMVHTYSLIHDDLPCMDDDDFRRGQPSLHKKYNEGHAVLTGDYLLTYAFEILANALEINAEKKMKLIHTLAKKIGADGMIGGQVMDLAYEGKKINLDTLKQLHRNKTGALITASIEFGGILSDATEIQMENLRNFGDDIGHAFQIVDDILDVTSSQVKHGKKISSDVINHKSTYVTLLGLEQSEKYAKELYYKAIRSLNSFGDRASTLIHLAEFIINRKH